jgi:anti-sigma factor RsiW
MDVVELTTELLGDTLDAVARAHIEQHLLLCSPCTIHLAQVRMTIALTAEVAAAPPPVEVSPALLAAFRKSRDGAG